jgi:hypothetical protein
MTSSAVQTAMAAAAHFLKYYVDEVQTCAIRVVF